MTMVDHFEGEGVVPDCHNQDMHHNDHYVGDSFLYEQQDEDHSAPHSLSHHPSNYTQSYLEIEN